MLRSMFSGVSGLRSHQTMMDVIGNNIANVNTVGFKASTAVFQDLLSQVMSGAGVPTSTAGGTNPTQIGLGVQLAGTITSFTQGASQLTGRSTDLSIQGDGFFVVSDNGAQVYTRAGALSFDATGRLVTPDGAILQGWTADATGNINANNGIGDLSMPLGQSIAPKTTTAVSVGGNLNVSANIGAAVTTSITVYDVTGLGHSLELTFTKADPTSWNLAAKLDGSALTTPAAPGDNLAFAPDPADPTSIVRSKDSIALTAAGFPNGIVVNFGTVGSPEALTGASAGSATAASTMQAMDQDGYAIGSLQSFSIGADGTVTGIFSNGRNRPIGQIAMATFSNPAGLESAGGSMYRLTPNSGNPQLGTPGSGRRGTISGSTLEMSNVDLAREFTNLIVAERGFQANSRVITTSDELLQDLVNLKR